MLHTLRSYGIHGDLFNGVSKNSELIFFGFKTSKKNSAEMRNPSYSQIPNNRALIEYYLTNFQLRGIITAPNCLKNATECTSMS